MYNLRNSGERLYMSSTELTPSAQKIDKLIKRIEEGDIKIPVFQRGFVWSQNQIIELLESIIDDYPIGSILLWRSSERLRYSRNIAGIEIPERDECYPVNYVLDGQQRLASIFGVFSSLTKLEADSGEYNPEKGIFEISYDFKNELFVPTESVVEEVNCIRLKYLLDVTRLLPSLGKLSSEYHQRAQELMSRFLNYDVPVVTIAKRNIEEVGIIFERINNTGTRLGIIDLMTAWTWTEDFHFNTEYKDFVEELSDFGFDNIDRNTILQIASGIVHKSTKTKDILKISAQSIRDNWDIIKEAVRKGVDFLSRELCCKNMQFIPFTQQLVVVCVFYSLIKNPTTEQVRILKNWFWRTSFSRRYSSGQTSAKMNDDIQFFKILVTSGKTGKEFDAYKININESALHTIKFAGSNPMTRAFILLMAQNKPRDLLTGASIDLDETLSSYNKKEFHHVFPDAFLKSAEITVGANERSTLLNFMFLTSLSNKKIGRNPPSVYMPDIRDGERDELLQANLLPTNMEIYSANNFSHFLKQRAKIVMELIQELTGVSGL